MTKGIYRDFKISVDGNTAIAVNTGDLNDTIIGSKSYVLSEVDKRYNCKRRIEGPKAFLNITLEDIQLISCAINKRIDEISELSNSNKDLSESLTKVVNSYKSTLTKFKNFEVEIGI